VYILADSIASPYTGAYFSSCWYITVKNVLPVIS